MVAGALCVVELALAGGEAVALRNVRVLDDLVGSLLVSLGRHQFLQADDCADNKGDLADDQGLGSNNGDRMVGHGQDSGLDGEGSHEGSVELLHLLAALLDHASSLGLSEVQQSWNVHIDLVAVDKLVDSVKELAAQAGRAHLIKFGLGANGFAERALLRSSGGSLQRHSVDELQVGQFHGALCDFDGLHLQALH